MLATASDVSGLEKRDTPKSSNQLAERRGADTGAIPGEHAVRTDRCRKVRTIAEDVSVSGNLAIAMGRETFAPVAGSELALTYGPVPLQRRYTNVYGFEAGRW